MFALLLTLMFVQGVPAVSEGGRVTGVLKTEAGAPVAGVRVAAGMVSDGSPDAATTLLSVVLTSEPISKIEK